MTTNSAIEARPSDKSHIDWLRNCDLDQFKGLRVLDLGCGSGFLCEHAVQAEARSVCGIDLVEPKGISQSRWQFCQVDLDAVDWSTKVLQIEEAWDLILAFDILEHVRSPYDFLRNIQSLLSPQGKLVLTTPNTASWERLLRPRSWSGATDPQHKCLFNRYSLQFLVDRAGLQPELTQAPIRKLGGLNRWFGRWGGQILLVASRS